MIFATLPVLVLPKSEVTHTKKYGTKMLEVTISFDHII